MQASDEEEEAETEASTAELSLSDILGVLNKPEKQAATILGVSLHSLRKNSRIHNIRRWPFRKIQISIKKGVKLSEEDILTYCQSEFATDLEGVDTLGASFDGGPSSPGGSSDYDQVLANTPSAAGGADARWGEVSRGYTEGSPSHANDVENLYLRDQSEEGDDSAKVNDDLATSGAGGSAACLPVQLPSMFLGRRIRYKFVCTPPEGYVPSELDAGTLPKGFFERAKDAFTLKRNDSFSLKKKDALLWSGEPKRQLSEGGGGVCGEAGAAVGGHARPGAGDAGERQPGGAVMRDQDEAVGGGGVDGGGGGGLLPVRKGPLGTHVCDALVFSRAVARDLETRGQVLSLPCNCQPPKKRFRAHFGYVTDPQQFFQIRNLPQRSPSPPPPLPPF